MKLFLLAPEIIFKARLNNPGSYAYPILDLEYDTVTLGSFSDIWPNQTVYIGSTEGASDLGVTRVRTLPDSNTLPIGLSSQGVYYGQVDAVDNAYLSVLSDWRVWAKIPRIDSNGDRWMDGALDFATYGEESPPVANAGPGFAGTIDSITGLITVTFAGTTSFATQPGATIASYGWAVGDGTITVGTSSSNTITATFPAGFRWVTLAVADSNSQTHYCHVPVLAIDPADDPCISNFNIESHRIRPDGQEMSVRVRDAIPQATYPDNTLCLIIDGEPSGPTDRSNVTMIGWAEQEPTSIDAGETGTLRDTVLNIVDVAGRLKSIAGFPQVLISSANNESGDPEFWGDMTLPNVDRFIHWLLHWQTTALDLADFTWSGTTTTYPFYQMVADGSAPWQQVERRAAALVPVYHFTCNRLGQLRVIVDPMLIDTGDRTATVQTTLDATIYKGIDYTRQRHPRYYRIYSNGVLASADPPVLTSIGGTAFSIAPGLGAGQGDQEMTDGDHYVVNQAALNAHCGHLYARQNAPESTFRITLATGDDLGIEPANLTWVRLTIPSTVAAQRGLTFTNARGLVKEMSIRYQSSRTGLVRTVTLEWERETVGVAAITEEVPQVEEVENEVGTPITPPVNPAAPPSFDGGMTSQTDNIAIIHQDGRIVRTFNFTDSSPNWEENGDANTDMGGSPYITGFVVDPFSPFYRGTGAEVNGYAVTNLKIWKIIDIFGTTPSATELYEFDQTISQTQGRWRSIAASFGRYFPTETDNPWLMVATYYNNSTLKDGLHVVYSLDAGATWSAEIEVSDIIDVDSINGARMAPALWLSPRVPGRAICFAKFGADAHFNDGAAVITNDWGASWASYSPAIDGWQGIGSAMHIPWEDNTDEAIIYYGITEMVGPGAAGYGRGLYRNGVDITPLDGTHHFGPRDGLFAIRAHDNGRQHLIFAGFASENFDVDLEHAGVFISSDGGDTWTQIVATILAEPNEKWPSEAAFAADTHLYAYIWGTEGFIKTYENGTLVDKVGDMALSGYERMVGLVGG